MTTNIEAHPVLELLGIATMPSAGETSIELHDQLNQVAEAVKVFKSSILEAAQIDPDLKPEARAERQHKVIDRAKGKLQAELDKILAPMGATIANLSEEVQRAAMPQVEKSEIGQLMDYLKAQEIRATLRTLDQAERRRVLMDSCRAGDRSILTALEGSLVPLLAAPLVESARTEYIEATARPQMDNLRIAKHWEGKARSIADLTKKWADRAVESDPRILKRPTTMTPTAGMTDAQKAAFSGQHGLAKWQDFLVGKWTPPQATTEEMISELTQ